MISRFFPLRVCAQDAPRIPRSFPLTPVAAYATMTSWACRMRCRWL